jgi:ABC-type multidrug transport system ATPase subunit
MDITVQEDTFSPVMTAMEALVFMSCLVLPGYMSGTDRLERVKRVLGRMGLRHASGTMVRLCIAVWLSCLDA